jgi:hypothetical protein
MSLLVEKTSTNELMEQAQKKAARIAELQGELMPIAGELGRREGFRTEGATSLEAWLTERCAVSIATARGWAHVATRLPNLPHCSAALAAGELSFDQVRAVVDFATPETDADLTRQAKECTVRQLHDLARADRGVPDETAGHDARYLRFNDARRTISGRLTDEQYATVRARISKRAHQIPSDGQTRWDQRLCDALFDTCRTAAGSGSGSGSRSERPPLVVVHIAYSTLKGGDGLAELERLGLINAETARRMACSAEIALAFDDDWGHTMYEGRNVRLATESQRREVRRRDQHCRFPSCTNVEFTNVHHIVPWIANGPTDISNLVLLCEHHHHRLHEKAWSMTGSAEGELTFVGPSGRPMTSRPSPLWTRTSDPPS